MSEVWLPGCSEVMDDCYRKEDTDVGFAEEKDELPSYDALYSRSRLVNRWRAPYKLAVGPEHPSAQKADLLREQLIQAQ